MILDPDNTIKSEHTWRCFVEQALECAKTKTYNLINLLEEKNISYEPYFVYICVEIQSQEKRLLPYTVTLTVELHADEKDYQRFTEKVYCLCKSHNAISIQLK